MLTQTCVLISPAEFSLWHYRRLAMVWSAKGQKSVTKIVVLPN